MIAACPSGENLAPLRSHPIPPTPVQLRLPLRLRLLLPTRPQLRYLLLLAILLASVCSSSQAQVESATPIANPNGNGNGNGNTQMRVATPLAILLPYQQVYFFSFQRIFPALELAVKNLADRGVANVTLLPADTQCREGTGMNVAIKLYIEHKPLAFIGLVCDYAAGPVIRQSAFWNVPAISVGCIARDFRQRRRDVYPTLTRVTLSLHAVAEFVLRVMQRYKWNKAKLAYSRNTGEGQYKRLYHFIAEALIYDRSESQATGEAGQSASNSAKGSSGNGGNSVDIVAYRFPENETAIDLDEVKRRHDLEKELGPYAVVVMCADPDSIREVMLMAYDRGFINGEYVFLNIDLFSSKSETEMPWFRVNDTAERNRKAREAYEAVLTITLRKPDSPSYQNFSEAVKRRAKELYPGFDYGDGEVNNFVGAFHDAVLLYAYALNETLEARGNISNGTEITRRMWNRTFEGITGTVSIDENGDRNADYSLLDLNTTSWKFEVVANYFGADRRFEQVRKISWPKRDGPPPDTPACGFDRSKCPQSEFPVYGIILIVMGALLVIITIVAVFVYRHFKLEAELASMSWRVKWEDIEFERAHRREIDIQIADGKKNFADRVCEQDFLLDRTKSRNKQQKGDTRSISDVSMDTLQQSKQIFTKCGYYKGALVAIKALHRAKIEVNKPLLLEIKRIKDLNHDHLVRFIGACIDAPHQCILTEYCPKGSLQDVLENDQIKLDWSFKFSLMHDIVRGMIYLHSNVGPHGNLKSSNCVVDSRFVLKLNDFGLHSLRGQDPAILADRYQFYRRKLWTAPELLRLQTPPQEGTFKADVYSFAIICQEIIYREGPFYVASSDPAMPNFLSPEEIISKLKVGKPCFRPSLSSEDCSEELFSLVERCWAEEPLDRPDFAHVKAGLRKINRGCDSGNILDNLLSRMEQYANNLEDLVATRTAEYLEQKQKAESLLYMMLPKSVASQLIRGEPVVAESYEKVSIYFSDICGFTELSATSTPMDVVTLLNDLYSLFDFIIESFAVYKVETIGDAYMVVSGLPERNANHAREIGRMSLALLNAVHSFKIRHRPTEQLKLRIGLNSGPVCAGVVGLKMPRYCLFGDTVNTASRMESNGQPLRIHISPSMKEELDKFGTFKCDLRGQVELKGKGLMTTWWLVSEATSPNAAPVTPHDRRKNSQASFKPYDLRGVTTQLSLSSIRTPEACVENGSLRLPASTA